MTETNGKFTDEEEADLRAAELVLGLLPEAEAERLRREAARNTALAADIARWEDRLARLADGAPEVLPPDSAWLAIERKISSPERATTAGRNRTGTGAPLWDNAGFWRNLSFASLGAAAAASIVAIAIFFNSQTVAPLQDRLVAALEAAEGGAPFVATYDPASKQILIVPAAALNEAQRVPELWLVTHDKRVISLGVIASESAQAVVIPPELVEETSAGAGLVITLEPPGGAPGGVATGPAIAQGELSPI